MNSDMIRQILESEAVDPLLMLSYRSKYERATLATLTELRDQALAAWEKRQLTVTITSASFEGGATSGQITGDPKVILAIFETLIAEKKGQLKPITPSDNMSHSVDFSKRRVEP